MSVQGKVLRNVKKKHKLWKKWKERSDDNLKIKYNKNSSGDEIANVNCYPGAPEAS